MSFYDQVYDIVKQIPKGKVSTYGQVAQLVGNPRAARAVGYALHKNPSHAQIPCHRIVNKEGKLAVAFVFGGINKQKEYLEKEGVTFIDDIHVNMGKHLWNGNLKKSKNFKIK